MGRSGFAPRSTSYRVLHWDLQDLASRAVFRTRATSLAGKLSIRETTKDVYKPLIKQLKVMGSRAERAPCEDGAGAWTWGEGSWGASLRLTVIKPDIE